tara:strand:+ start:101 stop:514 length:414 start_codon:yes stop_codon:yes gene_type:complete
MPIIDAYTQLFFNEPLNVSIQKGDMVYYVPTTLSPAPQFGNADQFQINSSSIREIGEAWEIFETSIVCKFECDHPTPTGVDCNAHIPGGGDFIMFLKDNAANMTSILGYYAEVKMVNDSNYKAKLFAVSTDVSASSK